jgi:hypothetical protein
MVHRTESVLDDIDFNNLGGKPNETNDTLIDLFVNFYWHRPEHFLGNGG